MGGWGEWYHPGAGRVWPLTIHEKHFPPWGYTAQEVNERLVRISPRVEGGRWRGASPVRALRSRFRHLVWASPVPGVCVRGRPEWHPPVETGHLCFKDDPLVWPAPPCPPSSQNRRRIGPFMNGPDSSKRQTAR